MGFDFKKLDVYRVSMNFAVLAKQIAGRLPRGSSHLVDQLSRASSSVVLNIAEGAGKQSKADKRRYYLSARGSAAERSAILELLSRTCEGLEKECAEGDDALVRIGSMLTRLSEAMENRDE
jgi:four helix bundle protein